MVVIVGDHFMICLSEVELLQKWLISHNDSGLKITANSRYGELIQTQEFVIGKYGCDIYNEIITGKKIVKNKKIIFLAYDDGYSEHGTVKMPVVDAEPVETGTVQMIVADTEPETAQIPFVDSVETGTIGNVGTEIHEWHEIASSILGTYFDYLSVRETVLDTVGAIRKD